MYYIYNGEVQIFPKNLDRFLSIAQRLKLEGLIRNDDDVKDGECSESKRVAEKNEETDVPSKNFQSLKKARQKQSLPDDVKMEKVIVPLSSNDVSEMQNTVNQYIEEKCEDGSVQCTVCGKVDVSRNKWQNLRSHIETHLEGFLFPCQLCGKTFRSTNSYNTHKCFRKTKHNQ